ncbi:MAG: hypothetical protein QGF30_06980 [Alphaproteobacteria bacterium]|nr:hypothetical protein [Alphaproteobacteria bacterium]MDP6781923.1 hypothetical protein [Alphaproteobacteria bacterium]
MAFFTRDSRNQRRLLPVSACALAALMLSAAPSMEVRGNTEKVWSRGVRLILRNYLLAEPLE